MSSIYSAWKHNKRRARYTVIGTVLGMLILGSIGYAIGFVIFPMFKFEAEALRDPQAAGILCGWICLILGFFVGARVGENNYRKIRRVEYAASRRERYAAQIEAYQKDRQEADKVSDGYEDEDRLPKTRKAKDKSSFESPWP